MRTVFNQFDSMIRPLERWLRQHGVQIQTNTRITNIGITEEGDKKTVDLIFMVHEGASQDLVVGAADLVLVTLGSMTEGSRLGSMHSAPAQRVSREGSAWSLWVQLAWGRPEFGRPEVFFENEKKSSWISFTATLKDPGLLDLIVQLTGNVAGEGGLITFADSNWLVSIVVPHQPHVLDQPTGISVFWGYALKIQQPGNFVKKPMSQCSGEEIMTEVIGHLGGDIEPKLFHGNLICIPCLMPFITSQFMPREAGDRPQIVPRGSTNLAFIGQFCEIADDVVFTVEYSVRSAQLAVYQLLGLNLEPPKVYNGTSDPRVLIEAFRALHDIAN